MKKMLNDTIDLLWYIECTAFGVYVIYFGSKIVKYGISVFEESKK